MDMIGFVGGQGTNFRINSERENYGSRTFLPIFQHFNIKICAEKETQVLPTLSSQINIG